jgi:hypothetical protein
LLLPFSLILSQNLYISHNWTFAVTLQTIGSCWSPFFRPSPPTNFFNNSSMFYFNCNFVNNLWFGPFYFNVIFFQSTRRTSSESPRSSGWSISCRSLTSECWRCWCRIWKRLNIQILKETIFWDFSKEILRIAFFHPIYILEFWSLRLSKKVWMASSRI